jgi:hypothetical protein
MGTAFHLGTWRATASPDRLAGRALVSNEAKRLRTAALIKVFEALRGLGYEGGYNAVRRYVRSGSPIGRQCRWARSFCSRRECLRRSRNQRVHRNPVTVVTLTRGRSRTKNAPGSFTAGSGQNYAGG